MNIYLKNRITGKYVSEIRYIDKNSRGLNRLIFIESDLPMLFSGIRQCLSIILFETGVNRNEKITFINYKIIVKELYQNLNDYEICFEYDNKDIKIYDIDAEELFLLMLTKGALSSISSLELLKDRILNNKHIIKEFNYICSLRNYLYFKKEFDEFKVAGIKFCKISDYIFLTDKPNLDLMRLIFDISNNLSYVVLTEDLIDKINYYCDFHEKIDKITNESVALQSKLSTRKR